MRVTITLSDHPDLFNDFYKSKKVQINNLPTLNKGATRMKEGRNRRRR